jgi:hypothetical protein
MPHHIDTKNLKRVSVLTDADCDTFRAAFNKCSDIVNAHDPSSGRKADAPLPDEIMRDIKVKTLDDECADIYRRHPFYKPPDLGQMLRRLVESPAFRRATGPS